MRDSEVKPTHKNRDKVGFFDTLLHFSVFLVGTRSSQMYHEKKWHRLLTLSTTSVNRAKSSKPCNCIRPHQSPEWMAALPKQRQIQLVEQGEKNLVLSLPFAIASFKNKASTQKFVMGWNKAGSFYKYIYENYETSEIWNKTPEKYSAQQKYNFKQMRNYLHF